MTTTRMAAPAAYRVAEGRAVLVAMICITVALDFARQPIYFLMEPIRLSFGLDDVQSSMLLGAAFSLPLTVMSLAGGWLCDRGMRHLLVLGAMLCWTAGVLVFALSSAYPALILGRALVGLGAGILVPVAMTWISDAFPEERRGKANGAFFIILSVGPAYGGAVTGSVQKYAEGGALASGAMLGALEPWRLTMLWLVVPTLLLLPLLYLLKDRRSGRDVPAGKPEAGRANDSAVQSWGLAALLIAGTALMGMVDTANITWMPTVLKRKFGWDAQQVGFAFGIVALLAGVVGPMLGGWLGDRAYASHGVRGRLWLSAVTACLCSVLLFAYFSDSVPLLMIALTLNGVLTIAVLVMGYVGLQAVLPPGRRGLGIGIMAAANSLVGAIGPTLVAMLSEQLGGGKSLATATALICPAVSLLAAGAMAASAYAMDRQTGRPAARLSPSGNEAVNHTL